MHKEPTGGNFYDSHVLTKCNLYFMYINCKYRSTVAIIVKICKEMKTLTKTKHWFSCQRIIK